MLKYRRAVLKLSGEALTGEGLSIIDPVLVKFLCEEVKEVLALGAELAIVVGGGNILRGVSAEKDGIDRVKADQAGMLATLINCLLLQDLFQKNGLPSRVLSAYEIKGVVEGFSKDRAVSYLKQGEVLFLACGTGNPFFSTDTAGVLRSLELSAQVLLKATKVDGVYDKDPMLDPSAKRYERLTYEETLLQGLKVMDLTAFSLAKEQNLPIIVFKFPEKGALKRALMGEPIGTYVGN